MNNHQERLRLTRTESRDETRMRLVDAAIELYARHGVAGVSLQLIAESAGYSRGAFHSNFHDKDELQEAVAAAVVASIAPRLGAILASSADSLERLGAYIRSYVQFCAENPERVQALIAVVGEQSRQRPGSYEDRADGSLAEIVALFNAGQATGQMRAFDAELMALTLRSALDAHSMRFSRKTPQAEWQRLADEMANTFQQATRKASHD